MSAKREYLSMDGKYRVSVISRDGHQRIRVECSFPVEVTVRPGTRAGAVRTGNGWYLAKDCRTVAEVEQFTPLADLVEYCR